jgi:hypothetical protein
VCARAAGDFCARPCYAGDAEALEEDDEPYGPLVNGCEEGYACFDEDGVCLPTGGFPGGPCRAADDPEGECDANVKDIAGADMFCKADLCVVDCKAGGDALCKEVDADLVCNAAAGDICVEACLGGDGGVPRYCRDGDMRCFEKDLVCRPPGAFTGGPCREAAVPEGECDAGVSDVVGADMGCERDRCVFDCEAGGNALCTEVDEDLRCAEKAGSICAEACLDDGSCRDPTFSCFEDDGVCLPAGSFPGGPCREGSDPCDHDLDGHADWDMRCEEDVCVVDCEVGGDAL